jgi:hypothetical protein
LSCKIAYILAKQYSSTKSPTFRCILLPYLWHLLATEGGGDSHLYPSEKNLPASWLGSHSDGISTRISKRGNKGSLSECWRTQRNLNAATLQRYCGSRPFHCWLPVGSVIEFSLDLTD